MKKRKIELLIFDLDGTLIDSRKDITHSVNYTRQVYQLGPLDMDTVASHIGYGAGNLINQCIPGLEKSELEKALKTFKTYYRDHCADETTAYPGVKRVLEYYKSKKMAVVSNKPSPFTHKILHKMDFDKYFQSILGEESHPKKKPDPGPLLYVAQRLGCKPESSCMVGDWITDIQAGQRAGMITVGCLYGIGKPEEIKKLNPDYLVNRISEILNLFD